MADHDKCEEHSVELGRLGGRMKALEDRAVNWDACVERFNALGWKVATAIASLVGIGLVNLVVGLYLASRSMASGNH